MLNVRSFVDEFFGDLTPSFEEVLTQVDIAISKREALSREWNFDQLISFRTDLLYTLVTVLDKQLRGTGNFHQRFVSQLFRLHPKGRFSFIDFNYDILLDNSLTNLQEQHNHDLEYGVDFVNFGREWDRPDPDDSIYLLKPHGSLNWLHCPTCNSLQITPLEKGVRRIWTDFTVCRKDKTKQQPLLIAPTWLKSYDNAKLTAIWSRMETVLRETTLAVFVGYSLPESDAHVRYLLTKFLRGRKDELPTVLVVTKKKREGTVSLEENRYKHLFRDPQILEIGFKAFGANLENHFDPIYESLA